MRPCGRSSGKARRSVRADFWIATTGQRTARPTNSRRSQAGVLSLVLGGCGLLALGIPDWLPRADYAHGIMGAFFGLLHLAYGVYLYFTEQRKNVA